LRLEVSPWTAGSNFVTLLISSLSVGTGYGFLALQANPITTSSYWSLVTSVSEGSQKGLNFYYGMPKAGLAGWVMTHAFKNTLL